MIDNKSRQFSFIIKGFNKDDDSAGGGISPHTERQNRIAKGFPAAAE